ncbi:DEAD/DEAH box helicase [Candidatus Woesearchaeota archaeon]|nr:DEAD/DEAH box helicase [Candidatus Woesearchaeota archaeon]
MIKNFTPRLYQETILATAAQKNTLVVLPTGLGKTNIFLMLAAHRLHEYPGSKILLLGPTKPLIDQYYRVFSEQFEIPADQMAIFTGLVKPEKRAELWNSSRIIFSTPQGLENDIIMKRINLAQVSLLGFDEAHRAVGDYSYVFVAKQYIAASPYPRIIGLTASPGSDIETIQDVCKNLFIQAVEVRTESDPDVQPYVQELDVHYVMVDLPKPLLEIRALLKAFIQDRTKRLKGVGIRLEGTSKREILNLQSHIRAQLAQGEKDTTLWSAISLLAEIIKISHALDLLETQGVIPLYRYMEGLAHEAGSSTVKAVKNIAADPGFKGALVKVQSLYEQKMEHPKLVELQKLIAKCFQNSQERKVMVFTQYRDNALDITQKLQALPNVKPALFVGQQKKRDSGMSQKQQQAMLHAFSTGEINVLVATSIGEEGLDIPRVDEVIFYEPVPSAIRSIQRRGRTGRHEKGMITVLVTKDTRDEANRWTAHHKEKRMYRNLDALQSKLSSTLVQNIAPIAPQPTEKTTVIADHREKGSGVIKALLDYGMNLKLEQLGQGDFILSERVGVEYKTVEDFVQSILDGRLLHQMKELKSAYERPLLIIEGTNDIYSVRNVHAHAIQGMLAAIAIGFGIPLLQTKNAKETASILMLIARREQEGSTKEFTLHGEKRQLTLKEQQEYIISSIPGIGPALAKELLNHFRTVQNVMTASEQQLTYVGKIGPLTAKKIRDIVEREY